MAAIGSDKASTPEPRHIVFDWDGTLFDSVSAMLGADNAIATRFGWPEVDYAYYSTHMSRDWRSYYDGLRLLEDNPPLTDDEVSQISDAWHVAHESLLETTRLMDDTRSVLSMLQESGITSSICSMHPHDGLQRRLAGFDLESSFVRVDGLRVDDSGTMSKVDHLREHLRSLRNLGISNDSDAIAFIGDSIDDAVSARAVGLRPVLVASGELSRERLEQDGAAVASSLIEALAILISK